MIENEETIEVFTRLLSEGEITEVRYVESITLKDGRVLRASNLGVRVFGKKKNLERIDKEILEEERLNEEICMIMSNDEVVLNEPDLYSPEYGSDSL